MNSIHVIHPYRDGGALVFDDQAKGLVREALIGGTDFILELAARNAGADPNGFTLIFAAHPFPECRHEARWEESGLGGHGDWYSVGSGSSLHMGWLCPALLKYFPAAPSRIYFRVQPNPPKESP